MDEVRRGRSRDAWHQRPTAAARPRPEDATGGNSRLRGMALRMHTICEPQSPGRSWAREEDMQVFDSGETPVSVNAEAVAGYVQVCIGGRDEEESRCATLKPSDARALAYALLLHAEQAGEEAREVQRQLMLATEVRREGR
jgi:hypothetical protein